MYDVIIIGAGASGLFAAVLLSGAGKKVLVLEQNSRAGKKLSLCGGGNCNLGPAETESGDLSLCYSQFTVNPKTGNFRQEKVRALKTLYFAYPPSLVRSLWTSTDIVKGSFRGLGIALREENGLLYPEKYDAPSLAEELCKRAVKSGAIFIYNTGASAIIKKEKEGYEIHAVDKNGKKMTAASSAVILATGGFSFPGIGGNDSGNKLLFPLSISCRQGKPAIGPVKTENYPFRASSGTVIPSRVSVISQKTGECLAQSKIGQLLFTHHGLSGPVILDLCAAFGECESEKPYLVLDFLPSLSREELFAAMQSFAKEHPKKQAVQLLSSFFPRGLSLILVEKAGINSESVSAEVSKEAMQKTVALVKAFRMDTVLPASRTEAIGWTGGCECGEIDFTTMEAKKSAGLFITGDMVSMCRPCGGYSLWFCWTSALAASIKIENY